MVKAKEDVERIHEIASELAKMGLPQKTVSRIHQWANQEARRLRDEARDGKAKKV
jgi:hypothetical protein